MQGLRERDRRRVPPERIAYLKDRGLEQAVETVEVVAEAAQVDADAAVVLATDASADAAQAQLDVDGLADGTTPFTGLNVGGDDKVGFLGKVASGALADATGLAAAVVETAAVKAGDITPNYYAYTSTAVLWTAESTEKTVQTAVVDVVRGDVRITGLVDIISGTMSAASAYGTLRLKRDGTAITNAERVAFTVGGAGTWTLPPQLMLDFSDSPGAGSFTYTITFEPSESITGQVLRRSLIALPLEG